MFRQPDIRHARIIGVALFAGVTLLTTSLYATTARLYSLGGGDFIEDAHNVQRWYGSLGDYPNLLTLESGHFTLPEGWHDSDAHRVSGPGLGLHLALDKKRSWGTIGFFLSGQGDDLDPGSANRDGLGTTWSAMWTRRLGPVQPTLMVRHGQDTGEDIIPAPGSASLERSWDRSRTEYGLGVRWDLSEGAYLDLAGELREHHEQTNVADPDFTVTGPAVSSTGSVGLRSRAFVRLTPSLALVPLVEYLHEDRPTFAFSPFATTGLNARLLKIGTGLNWYPDADHFLVLSLDYINGDVDYWKTPLDKTTIDSRSWSSLSLTMGFESRFQYWLTFRGSLRYEPVNLAETSANTPDDFDTFMVNLGAALQLGNYELDLALTDQEPRSVAGYYGNSLFGNPTTWLTLSFLYHWK